MRASFGICLALAAMACASTPKAPPVTGPLRPESKALPARAGGGNTAVEKEIGPPEDCPETDPKTGPPQKAYKDRSIEEGEAYATKGLKTLLSSEDPAKAPEAQNNLIQEAVTTFHTALAADPYNIKATYNLSAAYARIGRGQCALNLLARLAALKSWPSLKDAVVDAGNRLTGRAGRWKDKPDTDFDRLRTNETFRALVKQL